MAGGNQTAGIPQNLTAGRAQGYGMNAGMGNYGSPYANSGLGRFTSIGAYTPTPYVPQVYQPSLLGIRNSGPYVAPAGPAPLGGLLGDAGPGTEGVGNSGASTDPGASVAAANAMGIVGLGIPGLGNAVAAADSAMGDAAAAAGGGEGSNPGGVAAAEGTSSGSTGEGSGGGPPGDGGGGGGYGK